tara:strand:+ start:46 stop:639 length:594 start_codon:yes stop_codon:yes gene_type:complete
MSLAITELELTDVNTISIPTDAILMLLLLFVFVLIGYFFHNILNNQTNKFVDKVTDKSNIELVKDKLEDQLILESATIHHERLEQSKIKKPNYFSPSKLLGISSLIIVAIGGGSSILGIKAIQNSYKKAHPNQVNIKRENESETSLLSMTKIKPSKPSIAKTKKIIYVDPLLSTNNSSKNNNFNQITEKQTIDFFSF